MENIENILTKYECPKRNQKLQVSFEKVEDIIGFKLPDDYKKYMENYFGFEDTIGPEYVCLWSFEEIVELNKEYQIFESLPETLGIGSNGGGEFIAIEKFDCDKIRIVLSPFIDLDRENHIEIGNSFIDFLLRLDQGKEWFH